MKSLKEPLIRLRIGRFFYSLFAVMFVVLQNTPSPSFAASQETVIKEFSGKVSGVRRDFIAVTYKRENEEGREFEVVFRLEENTPLINRREWRDIVIGESVAVTYEEHVNAVVKTSQDDSEPEEKKVISRQIIKLEFAKREDETLISREKNSILRG